MEKLPISTEFIRLESALKLAALVMSGGEAKAVIQGGEVSVCGESCTQRGRKLRPGDSFSYGGSEFEICAAPDES